MFNYSAWTERLFFTFFIKKPWKVTSVDVMWGREMGRILANLWVSWMTASLKGRLSLSSALTWRLPTTLLSSAWTWSGRRKRKHSGKKNKAAVKHVFLANSIERLRWLLFTKLSQKQVIWVNTVHRTLQLLYHRIVHKLDQINLNASSVIFRRADIFYIRTLIVVETE